MLSQTLIKKKLEFYYSKEDEKKPNKFLEKNKIKDYIIIHPGFGFYGEDDYPSRLWPIEKYAKIVDYFVEKKKLDILFTGFGKEEKVLLHKARVLLSSVRYGEKFAGITKIFDPEKLINALSGRGYLKGHSESLKQYESARNYGLVKLIPTTGEKYEVHFIDNEENKKAVKMALEMLEVGEAVKPDNSQEVAKQILLPDTIKHPLQTRTHILKTESINRSTSTIQKINDTLRGIY